MKPLIFDTAVTLGGRFTAALSLVDTLPPYLTGKKAKGVPAAPSVAGRRGISR
jgi:hypothetical protein